MIAPLFNKFKKLENEELHAKVLEVARSVGADISTVEVEDTSKRDTRPNAYVGGAGKTRRMVVCDNMLEWKDEELVAVCGHEIGHWRLKHLVKTIPVLLVLQLISFAALKLIFSSQSVLDFAGVNSLGDPGAVPLFFFVFGLPVLLTGPLGSYISRVHEREADLFGLEAVRDAAATSSAFRKLQTETIGDLTPSLWNRLNRSHPLIAERLAMIKEWERPASPFSSSSACQASPRWRRRPHRRIRGMPNHARTPTTPAPPDILRRPRAWASSRRCGPVVTGVGETPRVSEAACSGGACRTEPPVRWSPLGSPSTILQA